MIGVKKNDNKIFEVVLPESYPQKEYANKKAKFECKILEVKKSIETRIDDELAKNLGAKDLNDLKNLISKQINDEYKNSFEMFSKNQILKQIEKFKLEEIPENLIEQEMNILTQGMKEDEIKKEKKSIEDNAKKRIKVGLILNEFGEQNKVKVEESEIQGEIQKQLRMMPGQEKMVMEFYQKNPSALASLRGNVYEDKIIKLIKSKAKSKKRSITKKEAERILKESHEQFHNHDHSKEQKSVSTEKSIKSKSLKTIAKKVTKTKKVSKK